MSTAEDQIAAEMTPDEDELEAEQDEQGDGGEQEQEQDAPESAAPAPRSQKEIDELTKKLENEAIRHANRVEELMGDDFALLVPSPVDWTPGFIFNVPEMHPTPEALEALHAILGAATAPEMREAADAEGCPDCNALGEVLTGSRKPGQITKLCVGCNGTGWVTKSIPYVAPTLVQNGTVPQNTGQLVPNQPMVADRWGRMYGHRDYGVDPSLVNA